MCGICGVYNIASDNVVSEELIRSMCDVMRHRGPDEDGLFFNGNVGLGMRRLKIIDLATGKQPIFNEDGSVAVMFNGEIYNFLELRESLLAKGHRFYTKTDTEVIVHLYEDHGEDFVNLLNGMFAIALWDEPNKQLLLYRDRLGKKPLHYWINKEGIRFSSEIKSLLCDGSYQKEMDEEAIYHYFSFYYIPAPFTIYKGIRKVLPGHYLLYKDGKAEVRKYWDFRYEPDYCESEERFCERLYQLLSDSVRLRLISDVPLGAFLSGGIDSSIVVGLMSRLSTLPVKTFSIGFKERGYSELQYARLVARRFNTEHHEFIVEPDAVGLVQDLLHYFDEPFYSPSAIPTYLISKLTRQYVTVALSGDGGDELFAGYESYLRILRRTKVNCIPMPLRRFIAHQIATRLPKQAKGKAFMESLDLDDVRFFYLGLSEVRKRSLFSQDFLKRTGHLDSVSIMERYRPGASSEFLSQFMYMDAKVYLPDDILVKVDRMSMANSLEARAPFLDYRLFELAAKIPVKLKMKCSLAGCVSKYILKKSMKDLLPNELLNRPKQGFHIPLDLWFSNDLKEMVCDVLCAKRLRDMEFLNADYILGTLDDHFRGRTNKLMFLWAVLIFLLWHETYYS